MSSLSKKLHRRRIARAKRLELAIAGIVVRVAQRVRPRIIEIQKLRLKCQQLSQTLAIEKAMAAAREAQIRAEEPERLDRANSTQASCSEPEKSDHN